jgi:predicted nicotinamide N-methyase
MDDRQVRDSMTDNVIALEDLAGVALVAAIEQRFDTVTEDVAAGGRTFSILRPRNSDDLITEEDFVKDERLPYWADIWPSSTILATHIVAIHGDGKRLLELGCGLGLVTTAAMTAGFDVVASDYYTDALAFTRANAFRNLRRSPPAKMINWREFPASEKGYDFVIASDVLYEREYAELLPGILSSALAPGGLAIIADPGRIGAKDFVEECELTDLKLVSDEVLPYTDPERNQQITLFRLLKSAGRRF